MVSIVIPTLNGQDYLEDLLPSLMTQSIRSYPIIVDSSSTDDSSEIATQHGVRVLKISRNGFNHGHTRNLGAQYVKKDILVFLTQDALPTDDYCLENLIKPLEDPQIIASFGRQIPRYDASPTEKFTRLFNYPETPAIKGLEDIPKLGIKTFFFSNVCSAIKTKEFKELGGFPENIIMFEDLIFAAKAILKGYKIAYVPEAKVWHSHNFTLLQQFRRYQDAGISLRNNAWIFEHTKANREGLEFLKKQLHYLSRNHEFQWIPYAIAESIFKFAGFWFGLHGISSRKISARLSTNSHYA
ncbi:MAG: N-glycosyltransferase [Deltaproteobacteria bacterium ADurb.Bin135]|nr:MAG: N-glycosyltransferase [Deltaproteobacteria bacterium ADurb.Bin135]